VSRFWHPVADMRAVQASGELILERGEGAHVWDDAGNRYLDATAGLWYANVGYGRTEIADAAAAQMRKLHAYSHYGDVSSRPTTDLAERISGIAPMADAAVFFTSGGGESIETVVKMVRRYWSLVGEPDRTVIISRERAYHGLAGYGTSIVGTEAFKVGVGPLAGGTATVAWDSPEALEAAIAEIGADRVAAFFCEPIIGAGGVLLPPKGYLQAVQGICRAHGVLFVVDEVICGYGRVGDWFASNRIGLEPDALTFAKGITSGYVPLGGVVVGKRMQEPFWETGAAGVWRHGYTYSGHASAAAAAHVNLDIVEREGLVARGLELENEIAEALAPLAAHELVSELRSGFGAVAAVQVDPALLADDPGLSDRIVLGARRHGVLGRVLVGGGLQISPPLVITRADLDELASGLAGALDDAAAAHHS
jgi:adenosylmethionine-8-amino-7-oxononanoate aminotransferase